MRAMTVRQVGFMFVLAVLTNCRSTTKDTKNIADNKVQEQETDVNYDGVGLKIKKLAAAAFDYALLNGMYPPHTKEAFIKALYVHDVQTNSNKDSGARAFDPDDRSVLFIKDGEFPQKLAWEEDALPENAKPEETDFSGPLVFLENRSAEGEILIWQKKPFSDGTRFICTTTFAIKRVDDMALLEHASRWWSR